ncbi:hypothetical protein DMUE_3753 [Dictyocoela muelleri]|nr:hypothetical protein DMUE_3753 [Dictyocoela muelleri]
MRICTTEIISSTNLEKAILTEEEIINVKFSKKILKKMFNCSKIEILENMSSYKLIRNSCTCECGKSMTLIKKSRNVDGYIWSCNENHRKEFSVRTGSFFEGFKKPFEDIMTFIYFWSLDSSQLAMNSFLGINKNAISDWCLKCRMACRDFLYNNSEFFIGGLEDDGTPKVVEIDESMFSKRKYNVGRLPNGQWVFGLLERGTRNCILITVPDRSANTLIPIIIRYVLPGTLIISDKWRSYSQLNNHGYQHLTVNHSQNFVSPDDPRVHTQNIESLWHHVKNRLRSQYGTRHYMLDGYLTEFMFKRRYSEKSKRINYFIITLQSLNHFN